MNPSNTFTEKYFLEEIHRFRELLGQKSFWEQANSEEVADRAIRGLSFVYLNLVNEDGTLPNQSQIDKWANIFDAAIGEYNRRKTYLLMLPLKRILGLVPA